MSLLDRNKAILQAVLAGQSYAECAATHALTKTAAMTAVRLKFQSRLRLAIEISHCNVIAIEKHL